MVNELIEWIGSTPLSLWIQNTRWVVPNVQSLHIIGVGIVIASVFIINFRFLGLAGKSHTVGEWCARFKPWIWGGLGILLFSGIIMIIGEPGRDLGNTLFWAKMALLAVVMTLTVNFLSKLKGNIRYWDDPSSHTLARKLSVVVSLLIWIAIVFAGRWIAYT